MFRMRVSPGAAFLASFSISFCVFLVLKTRQLAILEEKTPATNVTKQAGLLMTRKKASKHNQDSELTPAHYISKSINAKHVQQCLPNYGFLQKLKIDKTGDSGEPASKMITLIAAYEFEDHVVVTLNSEGMYGKQVYCRYLDSSFKEVEPPISAEILPDWHVYCCRRPETRYITVTETTKEEIKQWVPMQARIGKEPKYNMSLCLAPIYGRTPSWLLLAETIEHYLLQGVDHFYVYVQDMDGYSKLTLNDYLRSGQAEVIYLDHHEDREEREWHIVGVMDCLQRSKHESKYVIMADLDERIMLTYNTTLLDYARVTFQDESSVAACRFRPRWILRTQTVPEKYGGQETLNRHLPTLVYYNTSGYPDAENTAKLILRPTMVFLMWIHEVRAYTKPEYETFDVPPEHGIVRHYRDVVVSDWGTEWFPGTLKYGNYTHTIYPRHLMAKLYKNIKIRLDRIYTGKITTMQ